MKKLCFIYDQIKKKNRVYNSLKSKGALFVEYALILAFVVVVGVTFHDVNFRKSIDKIITKTEYLLDGKQGIFTADDFFTAVQKSEPPITYNGTTYPTIYDYIKEKIKNENYSFTSGYIEAGWDNKVDEVYKNGSEPIYDALNKSNFAGYDNLTWSVINGKLYVYEGKLNLAEHKNKQFTVTSYDVLHPEKAPVPATVTFVESKNGYGYLK